MNITALGHAATRPLPPERAAAIARAFLPTHRFGNHWDYYYSRAKLGSDPLYPGVLRALRGSQAPVLDLGCGLGLLAHALRLDGQTMAYRGVDNDAAKIGRACKVAAKIGLADARFDLVDLADGPPPHRGSVTILDVLQYLDAPKQHALINAAIAMLQPGSRLVIRTALADGSRRGQVGLVADRLAKLIGWMHNAPRCYPDAEALRTQLQDAGLVTTVAPLYGNTPFNNWLIVATR